MDTYWEKLLSIYQEQPPQWTAREKWMAAYAKMRELEPIYSPTAPSTDNPFVRQYAQAIDFMMVSGGHHLILPDNFMQQWREYERSLSEAL